MVAGCDTLEYRFVLIEDLSDETGGDFPGADIDAVVLQKANGGTFYAQQVLASGVTTGDVTEVVGAPDAFAAYPDVSTCDISQGFVGLGGDGGYVIVSLGDALEAGDTLDTL
ncbi:MAG: hypothetical protein AAF721_06110, partial [Myxococcota bacterium]